MGEKISQLDPITGAALAEGDLFVVVDVSEADPTATKRITKDELQLAILADYDNRSRADVPTLLADTTLTYTAGQISTVTAGDIVRTRAEGFSYEVAASGATDQHVTTTGGVKLYVLAGAEGEFSTASFGDVSDAEFTATLQRAFDSGRSPIVIPHGDFLITVPGVDVPGNVDVIQRGNLRVSDSIVAATYPAAIRIVSVSNVSWKISKIDATAGSFDNNIFLVSGCFDVSISGGRVLDSAVDRFPLGPFRVLSNTRLSIRNVTVTGAGGSCLEGLSNTSSIFENNTFFTLGQKSAIDVSSGSLNRYVGNQCNSPANTTTSAFSFNDLRSVCASNITTGGAFGITVGHVGRAADHSAVTGNVCHAPSSIGLNIQATRYAAITGNTVDATLTGITVTSGGNFNIITGNTVNGCTFGIRAGVFCVVTGNIVVGATTGAYQPSVDNSRSLHVGNGAFNGSGQAFRLGVAGSQINNVAVGNLAADGQATPTQTHGFTSLSARNLFVGNATDGNHTIAEFTGTFSTSPNKVLTETAEARSTVFRGVTGGTGSAGAGTQHIEIEADGVTYRVLHDGTV
jgi:hypothetical protein